MANSIHDCGKVKYIAAQTFRRNCLESTSKELLLRVLDVVARTMVEQLQKSNRRQRPTMSAPIWAGARHGGVSEFCIWAGGSYFVFCPVVCAGGLDAVW